MSCSGGFGGPASPDASVPAFSEVRIEISRRQHTCAKQGSSDLLIYPGRLSVTSSSRPASLSAPSTRRPSFSCWQVFARNPWCRAPQPHSQKFFVTTIDQSSTIYIPEPFSKLRGFPRRTRTGPFAIISASDNKRLGGVAPSRYRGRMPESQISAIVNSAACPMSIFDDDYDAFLGTQGPSCFIAQQTFWSTLRSRGLRGSQFGDTSVELGAGRPEDVLALANSLERCWSNSKSQRVPSVLTGRGCRSPRALCPAVSRPTLRESR